MLLMTSASDLVKVTTESSGDIEVHASWLDNNSGTITAGRTNTAHITGTGATTVVASPSTGQRNVKHLNVFNNHASVSNLITVSHTDGSNEQVVWKGTLLAGESVVLDAEGKWTLYDANGQVKAVTFPAATQADMESGSSLIVSVTPGRQHFHPSACKAWLVAGVTGNILASYNINSMTDTGTGVLTVTIETDFSSVNYVCQVSVQATGTTWAVANSRECHVRSGTIAAGSVAVDCIDNTTTTNLVKDPTTWHLSMFGDHA
jgi:hypothetical protein